LSLLVGVIIEEISKLMIVYFLNSILSLHFKNITYLLFAGLGFAFFEYLLINLDFYNFDLKENFLNYFPALLIHLTTFVIIGLGFLAALKKSRFVYYIFPLIFTSISVIIHIAFNSIAIIYNL
jgi:hypothetical protein